MKKKNILLINDFLEGGGAETVFREQFEILKETYDVEMFYGFKNISDRELTPLSYIYSSVFKQKLELFLKERSFDFVIVHNYNGALSPSILDVLRAYKKRKDCKLIYYAHDYHIICPNRGYSYYKRGKTFNFQSPPSLFQILAKRLDYRSRRYSILKKTQWVLAYLIGNKQNVFDLILTPSDFLHDQIKLLYPALMVKKMYNPCNALNFTEHEFMKKEQSSKLRLVYFGRLAQEKGLVDFICAITELTIDYSFTMIGEGDDIKRIWNVIEENELRDKIVIKPQHNHRDLFVELQNYDVFVLPSLWYENAPLSIVEASSVGLGLFLAHHGGVLEIGKICNASHFFDPFNPTDIVSKLEVLYNDFLSGSLPEPDKKYLQSLFSKESYIKNLKDNLTELNSF